MLQHDMLMTLRRSAKGTKEKACRKGPQDIAAYVVSFRGEDPVALVTINRHDPKMIMQVAQVCAGGFDADQIGVVFESYLSIHEWKLGCDEMPMNPLTGKPWSVSDSLADLVAAGGIEKGWITEVVSVTAVNRAGDLSMINLPFSYVAGRYLSWHDDDREFTTMDGELVGGTMGNFLRTMMMHPSASHYLPAKFGLDRNGRDAGTGTFLALQGHAVLVFADAGDSARLACMEEFGVRVVPQ